MFDTYVTVVGTVLHQPDKRVTNTTNALVSTFRVATHPRRYDPKLGQWVDAPSLRIRVNCWRRLAEHVAASVSTGDPVIVYGRISTREWKTETGETRVSYEMDADNVGHDLSRGMAQFTRSRAGGTSVIEDEDADNRVGGELTSPWAGGPAGLDETLHDDTLHEDRPYDDMGYGESYRDADAVAMLRAAGLGASPVGGDDDTEETEDEEEMVGAAADSGGVGGRSSRRRGRAPVPA